MYRALLLGTALVALSPPARAETVQLRATYAAYTAGFKVAEMQARIGYDASAYRMRMTYRTTGLLGAIVPGEQEGGVDGLWSGERAAPEHFWGSGVWWGDKRSVELAYHNGQPDVVALVPPTDPNLEPVPPAMQSGTIDALSAMIEVVRDVALDGRCEGKAVTFEGRRVVALTTHTAGEEELAPTSRSPYAGHALRCDFVGKQLAGFYRFSDRTELERPKPGSAWFAVTLPGTPPVPIRVTFPTRWLGEGTLYLTKIERDGAVPPNPQASNVSPATPAPAPAVH